MSSNTTAIWQITILIYMKKAIKQYFIAISNASQPIKSEESDKQQLMRVIYLTSLDGSKVSVIDKFSVVHRYFSNMKC